MNNRIKELTMIAIFPAMMAATAGIQIPLFNLPPITLQTFFVILAGLLLGPKHGALSMFVYVLLGAIGLPIFSGFKGGLGILLGGSGGFLVGFIISAYIIGLMKNVNFLNKKMVSIFIISWVGIGVIYMSGASYIAYISGTNIPLILASFVPYLFGDLIKTCVVVIVYVRVRSSVSYEYA